MKTSVGLIALIVAITATFVTRTIHAQNIVIMTEESSSVLDVMFNGTDITATGVNNGGANLWTITLPTAIAQFPTTSWAEPENPALNPADPTGWNNVIWISPTNLLVQSDLIDLGSLFANGREAFTNDSVLLFNDVSDGAVTTPDTSSTFGLLSLALAALVGASRLRSIQFA